MEFRVWTAHLLQLPRTFASWVAVWRAYPPCCWMVQIGGVDWHTDSPGRCDVLRCSTARDASTAEHALLFQTLALMVLFAFSFLTKLLFLCTTEHRKLILQVSQRGKQCVWLMFRRWNIFARECGWRGEKREGQWERWIIICFVGNCLAKQWFKGKAFVLDIIGLEVYEVASVR